MAMVAQRIALVAVLLVLTPPCNVVADPIHIGLPISSGTVSTSGPFIEGSFIDVAGPDFSFRAGGESLLDAQNCAFGCESGHVTSFTGHMGGLVFGSLVYQGRTFLFDAPDKGGLLFAQAPTFVLSAPTSDRTFSITTPFTLGGELEWRDGFGEAREEFVFALGGTGRATGVFTANVEGTLVFRGVTFDFAPEAAPIPEPTSLMLLATALGGMIKTACRGGRVRYDCASRGGAEQHR